MGTWLESTRVFPEFHEIVEYPRVEYPLENILSTQME